MDISVTATVKIEVTPELSKTIETYKTCLQRCVDVAWGMKIKNNIELHPFVYYELRKSLPSQLSIACIKQACGIVKKAKTNPIITKSSIRYNFPRSASLRGGKLSISTVDGRKKFDFVIPDCYRRYFDNWKIKESLLFFRKKKCYFAFTLVNNVDVGNSNIQTKVLGIDVGEKNLAVTSDNRFFRSAHIKKVKRRFRHLRKKLMRKGTRSSRRLLKRISGRENRFVRAINHIISKEIIAGCDNVGLIVMEDLTNIRKRARFRKRMNGRIANWSFRQLQFFIEYKANLSGIEVRRIKPNYTSQLCHICGLLGSRYRGCFSCSHCNLISFNSDLNASRNIAHPKLEERQAVVNQPIVTYDEAKTPSRRIAVECSHKPTISMVGS